jgi:SAM-dependent methyltransferase
VSAYPGRDLEAMAALDGYTRFVLESLGGAPSGDVLEVGAGIGNVATHYLKRAARAVLVEPDDALCARLAERMGGEPKVRVVHGTLEDGIARGEIDAGSFDACVLVNVLEHVQDDVGLVRVIGSRLRANGRLLCFVPALPLLFGSLDEAVGHVRRYRRRPLREVIEHAGFVVEELRYVDVLGVLPWLVAGRVLRRPGLDPSAARLYDAIGVPLTRALERRVRVPLGKNLACVARWP